MLSIFDMQCKKGCYQRDGETREMVRDFIQEENTNSIAFGNARGVRNIFERILVNQANRLAAQENVSRDDLMKITPRDILMSRGMEEDAELPATAESAALSEAEKQSPPESGGPAEKKSTAPTPAETSAEEKNGSAAKEQIPL